MPITEIIFELIPVSEIPVYYRPRVGPPIEVKITPVFTVPTEFERGKQIEIIEKWFTQQKLYSEEEADKWMAEEGITFYDLLRKSEPTRV
jgi:hypothetical protein